MAKSAISKIGDTKIRGGFTLLEVMLVIGILGLIVGLAIPFYQSFQLSTQLDNTSRELMRAFRQAQTRAMASESFSAFGVHLEQQKFVVFKGDTYSVADPANEVTEMPGVVSLSSLTSDVIFTKVKGYPNTTATVTVSTPYGESRTITINEEGVVDVR